MLPNIKKTFDKLRFNSSMFVKFLIENRIFPPVNLDKFMGKMFIPEKFKKLFKQTHEKKPAALDKIFS